MQDVTNRVSLSSFLLFYDIPLFVDSLCYFISDLPPSPAPQLETSQVILIYFPKCSVFGSIKIYARNIEFHLFLP
jgi:hypothetical protein